MPRPLGEAPPPPLPVPAPEPPGLDEGLGDPPLTSRRLQDLESPPSDTGGASFLGDGAAGSPQPRLLSDLPPSTRSEGVSPSGLTRPCQAASHFLPSQQLSHTVASPISP
ncbi:polyadenylation factor subunit 2-like [Portunus trituberculatus]|uniref:polyadenylation factor subunit 2-like n=1 Tax=Portunus trituberculatus TaxID=210409 RepID=UPI001E1D0540|nr:polyadenylation factor subunit 2-like [Portunus trituberculatus]